MAEKPLPTLWSKMSQTLQKRWWASNRKGQPFPAGDGMSVRQASKEIKTSERVKAAQKKSLKLYGATKGTRVGGPDGSGEAIRDTVVPLSVDQRAKVQAAERAAKQKAAGQVKVYSQAEIDALNRARGTAPKELSPDEKRLAARLSAIAAAAKKRSKKDEKQFDIPTMNPLNRDHDDLRDVHQSLHISRGYNEEVESVEEGVATAQKVMDRAKVVANTNPDPKKRFAAGGLAQKAMLRTINPTGVNTGITRGGGNKTYRKITGKVPPYQLTPKKGVSEEVEINEVTKKEAEEMLGGPVKEKPKMPPGKQPAGYRYVRGLARKTLKASMKKEEVELTEAPKDDREYGYEGDMAMSQLKSIIMNAQKLHDMLEPNTDLPEWVQSKITLAEDYVVTAANYCAGEMKEEVEQVDEKINLVKAKMGDVIKDFQKSDAPQFKGKSQEERRKMALAAKLKADRDAKNEEVITEAEGKITHIVAKDKLQDHKDEMESEGYDTHTKALPANHPKSKTHIGIVAQSPAEHSYHSSMGHAEEIHEAVRVVDVEKGLPKKPDVRNRLARAAKERRAITGSPGVKGFNKDIGYNPVRHMDTNFVRAIKKEEVVTEAEGSVPTTPKEKELAAHHGDPKKITYGDVIKARLKSAAAKKMGK